jgi:hypothetical protein
MEDVLAPARVGSSAPLRSLTNPGKKGWDVSATRAKGRKLASGLPLG